MTQTYWLIRLARSWTINRITNNPLMCLSLYILYYIWVVLKHFKFISIVLYANFPFYILYVYILWYIHHLHFNFWWEGTSSAGPFETGLSGFDVIVKSKVLIIKAPYLGWALFHFWMVSNLHIFGLGFFLAKIINKIHLYLCETRDFW